MYCVCACVTHVNWAIIDFKANSNLQGMKVCVVARFFNLFCVSVAFVDACNSMGTGSVPVSPLSTQAVDRHPYERAPHGAMPPSFSDSRPHLDVNQRHHFDNVPFLRDRDTTLSYSHTYDQSDSRLERDYYSTQNWLCNG